MADDPLSGPRSTGGERLRTVLFVDISGSTGLYHSLGDAAALDIVTRSLEILEEQVYENRGRVIKTIGDELMCLFPDASTAATAAVAMQQSMEHFAGQSAIPVTVKIGLFSGPVIEERGDIFGDAVNVASRLVEVANAGQIITEAATLAGMRATFRRRSRTIDRTTIKGKPEEVQIVEVGWRRRGGAPFTTEQAGALQAVQPTRLVVSYGEQEFVLDSTLSSFTVGRDPSNSLVIESRKASRQHARIERRRDKFVLFDHSTNGTYVVIEGEPEVLVKRESLLLRGNGRFCLGESPKSDSSGVVSFSCA
jgi:adenylate cyclase